MLSPLVKPLLHPKPSSHLRKFLLYQRVNFYSGSFKTNGPKECNRHSVTIQQHGCQVFYSHQHRRVHMSNSLSSKNTLTFDRIFSEENKKNTIEKLRLTKPDRRLADKAEVQREAAVLVPLCLVNGEPSILFMERSMHLSKHRGEISFPGGIRDTSDPDLVYTALRETEEEIGLPGTKVDIWGTMPHQPSTRLQGTWVTPVVGYCGDIDVGRLKLNKAEVESVFTQTLTSLCHPANNGSTQFRYKETKGYTLPVFFGEEHRIWGLTAIFLYQVLTKMAPGLYMFKLKHR